MIRTEAMKKFAAAAAAVILAVCLLTSCGSNNDKVLRVGVNGELPYWSTYDSVTGIYYGPEITLAKTLAERAGYGGVEFISVEPSDRDSAIDDGLVDCLMGMYLPDEESEDKYEYSKAYYSSPVTIIAEKTAMFPSFTALSGQLIGIYTDCDAVSGKIDIALAGVGHSEAVYFYSDSLDALSSLLEEGSIDAVAADNVYGYSLLDSSREKIGDSFMDQEYRLKVMSGTEAGDILVSEMNKLISDGTAEEIIVVWE